MIVKFSIPKFLEKFDIKIKLYIEDMGLSVFREKTLVSDDGTPAYKHLGFPQVSCPS